MTCIECKSEIPDAAAKCRFCRSYQAKYKNSLQYWGGLTALVTLAFYFFSASLSAVVGFYKYITWKDKVVVVQFNSEGLSTFFNAGNGPLFLSHITVQTDQVWYEQKKYDERSFLLIDKMINTQEFIGYLNPIYAVGNMVRAETDDEYGKLFALHTQQLSSPCTFMYYFSLDSTLLLALEQAFQQKAVAERREYKLRTVNAEASLEFYS